MSSRKSGKSQNSLIALGAFVFGCLIVLIASVIALARGRKFSPEGIDQTIQEKLLSAGYGQNMVKYWRAIARVETTSPVTLKPFENQIWYEGNNLFGMKVPTKRPSDRIGEILDKEGPMFEGYFSKYRSPGQSVDDLILYLKYMNYARDYPTAGALLQDMKSKGYFELPYETYLSKVNKYLQS